MQEVSGSIPLTSTICNNALIRKSPSSRGLGHHPFTVSTGVRIPVGTPQIGVASDSKDVGIAWLLWHRKVTQQDACGAGSKLETGR
jgi:hypothetical protein